MESMLRWLLALLVLLALAGAGAYVAAGRGAPPQLTIDKPDRFVGQTGTLDVTAEAPNARFTALDDHARAERPDHPALLARRPADRERHAASTPTHAAGRRGRSASRACPSCSRAPARIVVTATRPSFLNLRS